MDARWRGDRFSLTNWRTTGQLDTLSAPGGQTLGYGYDGFLVTSETAGGAVAGTVSWSYNSNFWVTSQSVAGSAISFGYDNDGLLTTAGALTLTRNAGHGLVEGTTLSTGAAVTTSHGYSSFGELSGESASIGGAGVYSASYGSGDKLGRIVQRSETVQGQSRSYAYGYDAAGRLDTVHVDGVLVSDYGYDANGNLAFPHLSGLLDLRRRPALAGFLDPIESAGVDQVTGAARRGAAGT